MTQAGLDERDVQRESALSDRHALRRVTQRHLLHETDLTVGGEAERTQVTGLHTELSEPGSSCRDGECVGVEVTTGISADEAEGCLLYTSPSPRD